MSRSDPKDNSRKSGDAVERRRVRQEEAVERQAQRDKLSPEEQLAILDKREPRGAHKERAKLLAMMVEPKTDKKKRKKVAA